MFVSQKNHDDLLLNGIIQLISAPDQSCFGSPVLIGERSDTELDLSSCSSLFWSASVYHVFVSKDYNVWEGLANCGYKNVPRAGCYSD